MASMALFPPGNRFFERIYLLFSRGDPLLMAETRGESDWPTGREPLPILKPCQHWLPGEGFR